MSAFAGVDYLIGAIYVLSTVKSAVGAVQYAKTWYTWIYPAEEKETGDYQAWQWVEDEGDEFEIEKKS